MAKIIILCILLLLLLPSCDQTEEPEPELEPRIEIQDVIVGDGSVAEEGSLVSITYVGKLTDVYDSRVFDTSDDGLLFNVNAATKVMTFILGSDDVIEGLTQGIAGMRQGGKRIITIPHQFAFQGGIDGIVPTQTTAIYEVDLLRGPGVEVVQTGQGEQAALNNIVSLLLDGRLPNGTLFYTTVVPGGGGQQPYTFTLGQGHTNLGEKSFPFALSKIVGLHYGVIDMQIGGKRRLTVAPALAYGSESVKDVPPNTTLTLDIELVDVK